LKESVDGVQRLEKELKVKITRSARLNPLRGLTPLPDAAGEGFYFVNTSYFCFQGYQIDREDQPAEKEKEKGE